MDIAEHVRLARMGAELISAAAAGSLEAQRMLVENHLRESGPGPAHVGMLLRIELVARMAAAQGDEQDRRQLAAILWSLALAAAEENEQDGVRLFAVAAIATLRELVDAGDGLALDMLADVRANFPGIAAEVDRERGPVVAEPEVLFPLAPIEAALASLPPVMRFGRSGGARGPSKIGFEKGLDDGASR